MCMKKICIEALSVIYAINFCGVAQQQLGGVREGFPPLLIFLGIYVKVLPNFISEVQ